MTTSVLFLCTHNSARSVLAEAMLNHWAGVLGRDVRGYSAGSAPSGQVKRHALRALERAGVATAGLRSKNWSEFAASGAAPMRIVVTVCDRAAAEACPYWPGAPVRVHWSYADPSGAAESDLDGQFDLTRQALGYRLLQLLALPLASISDADLQAALAGIGRS